MALSFSGTPSPTEKNDGGREEILRAARALLSNPRLQPMPSGLSDIRNGTLLRSERDVPEVGVRRGMIFPVVYDGTYVRGGNLDGPTWSVDELRQEYAEKKWWTVVGQLDDLLQR